MGIERVRGWAFTVVVTAVSWFFRLRDVVVGFDRKGRWPSMGERRWIASGDRRLEACWVAPPADGAPVVLVCHGIGEKVSGWGGVQAYLRDEGVGSLVFDYSGYGRSSGWISWRFCEEDLLAAYGEVRRLAGEAARVYVLGFSLGTGIAAQGAARLEPEIAGLILCESFPTFREAAGAAHIPRWLSWLVPEIWDTVEALRGTMLRVLVVHSEGDRLFSVAMGRRVAEASGGEMLVVSGYGHDDLYRRPEEGYWGGVVRWIVDGGEKQVLRCAQDDTF